MTGISNQFVLFLSLDANLADLIQVQQFVPGESFTPPSTTIRQHVTGEATDAYGGFAPEEQIPLPPPTEVAPVFTQPQAEIPIVTVEPPITEPEVQLEALDQGKAEPLPTQEQRPFSAPHVQWDATRYDFGCTKQLRKLMTS